MTKRMMVQLTVDGDRVDCEELMSRCLQLGVVPRCVKEMLASIRAAGFEANCERAEYDEPETKKTESE